MFCDFTIQCLLRKRERERRTHDWFKTHAAPTPPCTPSAQGTAAGTTAQALPLLHVAVVVCVWKCIRVCVSACREGGDGYDEHAEAQVHEIENPLATWGWGCTYV